MFEVVELSAFTGKDVQNDVAVVLQNPRFRLAAFDADARAAASFLHQLFDFLGNRSHLAAAVGGRDDEEIHDRRDGSHVENERVLALEVRAGLRGQAGEFTTGLLALGQGGAVCFGTSGGSDGNVSESSELNEKFQKLNRPTSFEKQSLHRARLAGQALGRTAEPQGFRRQFKTNRTCD